MKGLWKIIKTICKGIFHNPQIPRQWGLMSKSIVILGCLARVTVHSSITDCRDQIGFAVAKSASALSKYWTPGTCGESPQNLQKTKHPQKMNFRPSKRRSPHDDGITASDTVKKCMGRKTLKEPKQIQYQNQNMCWGHTKEVLKINYYGMAKRSVAWWPLYGKVWELAICVFFNDMGKQHFSFCDFLRNFTHMLAASVYKHHRLTDLWPWEKTAFEFKKKRLYNQLQMKTCLWNFYQSSHNFSGIKGKLLGKKCWKLSLISHIF